jgi:hypothetical protein
MKQPMLAVAAAMTCAMTSNAASADTYSVSISNPMDLGLVTAAPSGSTVFQINPSSGQISLVSGDGRRLSSSLVRALVTIRCEGSDGGDNGGGNDYTNNGHGNGKGAACRNNKVGVVIGAIGITTGRAQPLTSFTVSMSSASLSGGVSGSNPISFTLNPVGDGQTASFYLGANFPVAGDDSGRPTGLGLSPFYVLVREYNGDDQLASLLSAGVVTAYRSLGVSKVSDLQFGIVSRPKTSGTVTLDPNTGVRTVTGGAVGFASPPPTLASFEITGEGGQAFSVSLPSTLQLGGPTNLNVHTTTNLSGTPVLSNSLGGVGTFTLKVGGSFPIANGSLTGTYSGTFSVTVNYN